MKHILVILFLSAFVSTPNAKAQKTSGTIEYDRKQDWVQISSKLPYMTQEEIDRQRLSWGRMMNDGPGQPYTLYFNADESLYTYSEDSEGGGFRGRGGQDEYLLIRDYANKTVYDQVDVLGKTYIIQEDAERIKWKILNEIKEVAGYLCMKAETIDPVKGTKVHAWFSDEIPVYGGPEGYFGLPGMILGLDFNDGDVVITATKVNFSEEPVELPIPKKMKGKNITYEELHAKKKKYIDDTIEGRRNPYWQLRY
jgi:GLPGLI family protein